MLCTALAPEDQMYTGSLAQYLAQGASALEAIHLALRAAALPLTSVHAILDLPCGHGRVLRHLRASWPHVPITACDLDLDAVQFCATTFDAIPLRSDDDPQALPLAAQAFDLIWVGSLLTHLPPHTWHAWLCAWQRWLTPGGVLVVTTHGRTAAARLGQHPTLYDLTADAARALLAQTAQHGVGWVPYAWNPTGTYGVTATLLPWVLTQVLAVPGWQVCLVQEQGWDQHQDVVALVNDR